ncbi:MAG: cytochrome P450, partial [Micromonosporaceae bacterium]
MLFRTWEAPPPVAAVTERGGHWLVSGHSLVRRVLADPETFRPDNALDATTPLPVAAMRILTRHGFRLPATLANNGTGSHPGLRAVVAEALHPDRVEAQRGWLTGLVRRRVPRLAAALRSGAPVDLHAEVSADLPLLVLARLVELPASDIAVTKAFSAAALELFWAPLDEHRQRVLAELVGDFHSRLRAFVRSGPGGLVGRLTAYTRDHGLGEDEVVGVLFFLLVAGQETTSQFLTLLLHRLVREPAVLAGVSRGTLAVDDVVEEGLRTEPPIVTWRRVTAREVRLGPAVLPA